MNSTHKTTIVTYSGQVFDFAKLDPNSININDIAHALSFTCRFNGHLWKYYSVANHSVLVSRQIKDPYYSLIGLLHDAAEAYIGDLVSPMKYLLPESSYRDMEAAIWKCVCQKFDIYCTDEEYKENIKSVDIQLLVTELRDLKNTESINIPNVKPLDFVIVPWSPRKSEILFLKRYYKLCQKLKR